MHGNDNGNAVFFLKIFSIEMHATIIMNVTSKIKQRIMQNVEERRDTKSWTEKKQQQQFTCTYKAHTLLRNVMNMNVMIFSMLAPLKQLQTLWRQIANQQNQTEPYMNNNDIAEIAAYAWMEQNSCHTYTQRERERERLGIRDQIEIRHELKDLRVNLIITCNYYHIVISRNKNKNKNKNKSK